MQSVQIVNSSDPRIRNRSARSVRYFFAVVVFCLILLLLQPLSSVGYRSRPVKIDPQIPFQPSSFAWDTVYQQYPVTPTHLLPTAAPKLLPPVQNYFAGYIHDATTKMRQAAVRGAFERSWNSYKTHAWLRDELAPVTGTGKTTFGGWAATLVDALDTLWIMDFRDEFLSAAAAAAQLDWANTTETSLNLFETTTRHLGGLLSAYELSGQEALLAKATELGNMLYMAFDTPNRLPGCWLNFEDAKRGAQLAGTNDPSACPTSPSLEFTRLSQLTGDRKYYDAISRVADFLERTQTSSRLSGMWPKLINFREETVNHENGFTLDALAGSLYEYLPKMHILLGGREPRYEKMYRAAMEVVVEHLVFRPMVPPEDNPHDILFVGDAYAHPDRIGHVPESQHLSCFAGRMFGLGGKLFTILDHVDNW